MPSGRTFTGDGSILQKKLLFVKTPFVKNSAIWQILRPLMKYCKERTWHKPTLTPQPLNSSLPSQTCALWFRQIQSQVSLPPVTGDVIGLKACVKRHPRPNQGYILDIRLLVHILHFSHTLVQHNARSYFGAEYTWTGGPGECQ